MFGESITFFSKKIFHILRERDQTLYCAMLQQKESERKPKACVISVTEHNHS